MEVSVEDVYRPGSILDIPHRPPWSYSMTKQQLDKQEESAFQDYLSRIHSNHHPHELSLFEHNLEVYVDSGNNCCDRDSQATQCKSPTDKEK